MIPTHLARCEPLHRASQDTDPVTQKKTGFVQHPYIPKGIRMAFFGKAAMGMGFMFPKVFDPIRTETVALILTVVRTLSAHLLGYYLSH